MRLFGALKNRSFALLWTGQTISRIGDFLYQIALAWWVLKTTGSAAVMGTVMIVSFAPMLIMLLIGGAAVDRYNRVKVMLLSDVSRGVIVLIVGGLAITGRLQLWEVFAASVVFGFVDAFFNPAYAAAVPEMVEAERLGSANAMSSLSQQMGRVLGPALGAGVIALGGTGTAFVLNGLSFFLSAAFLLPLLRGPKPPAEGATANSSSVFRDVCDGIGFVAKTRWLWTTIAMFTAANVLLAGPFSVSLPFLVQREMHGGVMELGLLSAMFPVGYAVAAIVLGRLERVRRRGMLIYGGAVIGGTTIALFGLHLPIAALAAAAILNGLALEAAGLAWISTLQERVPAAMLGRVSSIDSLGSFALLPIGYALAGWATDRYGPAAVFLVGGSATALIALIGMFQLSTDSWD